MQALRARSLLALLIMHEIESSRYGTQSFNQPSESDTRKQLKYTHIHTHRDTHTHTRAHTKYSTHMHAHKAIRKNVALYWPELMKELATSLTGRAAKVIAAIEGKVDYTVAPSLRTGAQKGKDAALGTVSCFF